MNETLLDLDYLLPLFGNWFGDEAVMREWFAQLILYSQTVTLAGLPGNFGALAGGVLHMLGTIHGVAIADGDVARLRQAMGSLPAHPDAAEALAYLGNRGFRMVTLTNSPLSDMPSALDRAGLGGYFERSFSVQSSGCFKPAPQTYRLVSEALAVPVDQMCLVACHVWDTIGLQTMGGKGALVTHGVNAPLAVPGVPQPDLIAADLTTLARMISTAWAS